MKENGGKGDDREQYNKLLYAGSLSHSFHTSLSLPPSLCSSANQTA